jgi:hypothetical protein
MACAKWLFPVPPGPRNSASSRLLMKAPLLDHMGAVIDHVEAHSGGGSSAISNLATACNKCNGRKSASSAEAFSKRRPRIPVKGKYGDPLEWDGLSSLFVVLIAKNPGIATATERGWLRALITGSASRARI